MFALLHSLAIFVIDFFKSPRRLQPENLFLRHQLSIALRRSPPLLRLRGGDRALMEWLTWLYGWSESAKFPVMFASSRRTNSIGCNEIPYATEQGIFASTTGNFFKE